MNGIKKLMTLRFYLIICICMYTLLITGCGPRSLESGAEYVRIRPANTSLPKSCKFLAVITDSEIHSNDGLRPSAEGLSVDDKNLLKNEGAKRGANVVVLKQHQIIETYRINKLGKARPLLRTTKHNILGSAYACP